MLTRTREDCDAKGATLASSIWEAAGASPAPSVTSIGGKGESIGTIGDRRVRRRER